jgi:hypothetical protein
LHQLPGAVPAIEAEKVEMLNVEELRIRLKKQDWCSALSRMYLVKNYTLGKGKRDSAYRLLYLKERHGVLKKL